jgi:IclR-like helix-turn-helix domain-containing protein
MSAKGEGGVRRTRSGVGESPRGSEPSHRPTSPNPGPSVGLPHSVAAKVGSSRLAIFEVLAANDLPGMVIPEIIRASGVPKSTVHRVIADFEARGLIVRAGRRRKAPLFRLNPADEEVVHVSKALSSYRSWRTGEALELYRRQELVTAKQLRMNAFAASQRPAPPT